MTVRGKIKNGKVLLDDPKALPNGMEVEIRPVKKARKARKPTRSKAARADPGCFESISPVKRLNEQEKRALQDLLSEDQFKALIEVVEQGGPDIETIRKIRALSML